MLLPGRIKPEHVPMIHRMHLRFMASILDAEGLSTAINDLGGMNERINAFGFSAESILYQTIEMMSNAQAANGSPFIFWNGWVGLVLFQAANTATGGHFFNTHSVSLNPWYLQTARFHSRIMPSREEILPERSICHDLEQEIVSKVRGLPANKLEPIIGNERDYDRQVALVKSSSTYEILYKKKVETIERVFTRFGITHAWTRDFQFSDSEEDISFPIHQRDFTD